MRTSEVDSFEHLKGQIFFTCWVTLSKLTWFRDQGLGQKGSLKTNMV